MNILRDILEHKRSEVRLAKKITPVTQLKAKAQKVRNRPFAFQSALRNHWPLAVIAEIKKKSPSKGIIRKDFRPTWIAAQYAQCGASALSVLTDEKYFGGSLDVLKKVRKAVRLPILRKDFIVDTYQIYEAKAAGADAVLLIAGALPVSKLRSFYALTKKLSMDALFEVHDKEELKKILPLHPKIVGVNNRDLRNFRIDLATSRKLSARIPADALFVSESGIFTAKDLLYLKNCGADAVLVGESLMRQKNPGQALKRLIGESIGTR